jgi:hypothetical protein
LPCTCSYLQEAADDPENPIVFDKQTEEFQFQYTRGNGVESESGMLLIFHCPFCGGSAPRSIRDLLFARTPNDEVERISELLTPIQTLSDAVRDLGPPDSDSHGIARGRETDDHPSSVERIRQIGYQSISEVAEVCFQVLPNDSVHWQLFGKPLGAACQAIFSAKILFAGSKSSHFLDSL